MKAPAKTRPAARKKAAKRDAGSVAPGKDKPSSKRADTVNRAASNAAEADTHAPAPSVRVKLVRDSFTMPREDFDLVARLKARALEFKRPTKKSELLRAGLQQLAALSEAQLRDALAALRPLQAGRPKKKR